MGKNNTVNILGEHALKVFIVNNAHYFDVNFCVQENKTFQI